MGLDIYVGTFTRYYQRDWQTIIQQAMPGKVRIVRPQGDAAPDPALVVQVVDQWRTWLAGALETPRLWDEGSERPYFTDKPDWPAFLGLVAWAAYEDQGIETQGVNHASVNFDSLLGMYKSAEPTMRYPQLLLGAQVWLPIASPGAFEGMDATGNARMFGNCERLMAELNLLNDRTWKADAQTAAAWAKEACSDESLESQARFGWAVTRKLVQKAVEHELPMILDF